MADSPNARRSQEAAPRDTEGGTTLKNKTKHGETQSERKRGRPKGSKNKPKALIPKEVANDLLGVVKTVLPPELYDEMKKAVKDGKNISTINEARILMKLMGPPIWLRLIEEAGNSRPAPQVIDPDLQDEIGELPDDEKPGFDKGLNERLKVLINLMQFVAKLEQEEDDKSDNTAKPILEIIARRGYDAGRIKVLAGYESGDVGGNPDGVRGGVIDVGAVSDTVPQRQVDVQDSQQEPPVRVLDATVDRDDPRSSD